MFWTFKLSFNVDILTFFGHFVQKLGKNLILFLVTLYDGQFCGLTTTDLFLESQFFCSRLQLQGEVAAGETNLVYRGMVRTALGIIREEVTTHYDATTLSIIINKTSHSA